jgi:hypothetical protein
MVLVIESMALYMLGKCSTHWVMYLAYKMLFLILFYIPHSAKC